MLACWHFLISSKDKVHLREMGQMKDLTPWWCLSKIQGIIKVITIHTEGYMNMCIKLHVNPSNNC